MKYSSSADPFHRKQGHGARFGQRQNNVERELDRARANAAAAAEARRGVIQVNQSYEGFRINFSDISNKDLSSHHAARLAAERARAAAAKAAREAELRARHPDLAAIEGKDLDFTLVNMPGAPRVVATWHDYRSGFPGWALKIRLPCRLVESPETESELQRDVFLSVGDVLRRMQLDERGPSALRAIGEVVRERLLFLYVHELDESLKLNGVRVRNPHPRSESFFQTKEYLDALDDQ